MKILSFKQFCLLLMLCICPLLLGAAAMRSEEDIAYTIPSVSLTLLSEKPLTIGDPIDLALTVYHDKKKPVVYPEESASFTPFVLRDYNVKSRKVDRHADKTIVLYTISVFQTGDVVLNPLTIKVGDTDLKTAEMTIRILSVLPGDEAEPDLMDIVPPYKARIRNIMVFFILLGVAAAAALFILVRKYLIHPRQVPKTIIESDAVIDPYECSIRELEHIKKEHRKEKADSKLVYSTISHSLKLFFGSLFTIQALEMTTSELKRYMRRSGSRRSRYIQPTRLINILHRSDMVKFARETPPHIKVEQDINQSIMLIKEAQGKVLGEEPPAPRPVTEEPDDAV